MNTAAANNAKKRWWPRVHLSTVVVMFFAAAVLLGLNMWPQHIDEYYGPGVTSRLIYGGVFKYGWPLVVKKDPTGDPFLVYGTDWSALVGTPRRKWWEFERPETIRNWDLPAAAINLGVAVLILAVVVASCEVITRKGFMTKLHAGTWTIVLPIVGALLAMNMRVWDESPDRVYGWPFVAASLDEVQFRLRDVINNELSEESIKSLRGDELARNFDLRGVLLNVLCGILILITVAAFSEIILYRRKRSAAP